MKNYYLMYYDLILIIFLLHKNVKSLLYDQISPQGITNDSVLFVEDEVPSKIACIHKCMYMQAEALYTGLKCQCLTKKKKGINVDNDGQLTGTYMIPKEVNKGTPKKAICAIPVLSINSSDKTRNDGTYFHFNRYILGLKDKQIISFNAKNSRSGIVAPIKIWAETMGGKIGDSHGRYVSDGANGDWKVGDYVIILDKVPGCIEMIV